MGAGGQSKPESAPLAELGIKTDLTVHAGEGLFYNRQTDAIAGETIFGMDPPEDPEKPVVMIVLNSDPIIRDGNADFAGNYEALNADLWNGASGNEF
ncbi:MAG: hypothetical protein JWM16_1232 [Verrucomicrobiales bacterium]|nr:hypothetical protein [Verrucomicrobiales bacterium]